jgi:hypothetical protein
MEIKVRIEKDFNKVLRAAERSNDLSLRRAGAYVRGVAMKGIKTSKVFSKPGDRPHTRKGRLRKSIIFAVDQKGVNVLIGPHSGVIGKVGATHEFGGTEPAKKLAPGSVDASGRPIKVPGTNWKIGPGGFGPIAFVGVAGTRDKTGRFLSQQSSFRYAHLFSMAQVRRSQAIAEKNIPALAMRGKIRKYPKRAFMRPTLNAILDDRLRIPSFWYASVRG